MIILQHSLVYLSLLTEDGKIDYYKNDELQASNYSICPIDLGKYREK